MAKELIKKELGSSGLVADLSVDKGNLKLSLSLPLEKILTPLKTKVVDKLKALIPGTWDDTLLDKAWADGLKSLGDE